MNYSAEAIRHSLGHFVLGKAVTGFSGVVLLVLLARTLSTTEFAVYSTLQGIVLVVGAVTAVGINQAVLRFLPEMRALGHNAAMYRLLWRTTGVRCGTVALGFIACGVALPWVGHALGLEVGRPWILAYFAVGTVRLVGQFVATATETLLWPRVSQYPLALASVAKLLLILVLFAQDTLDFRSLVLVEALTETLALLGIVAGLRRNQQRDPQRDEGDPEWVRRHAARMRAFGRRNYVASLLSQLSTTAPYRVIAAATLSVDGTALLGLVFSIADLMRRFLPAEMGRFLMRSILVAQASTGTSMPTVNRRLNLNFRANALLLTLLSSWALAGGTAALAAATGGKYTGAGPLLAGMGTVLLLNLWRTQFDLLASISERVEWTIWSNLGLLAGPAVAWLAVPQWQSWAIVAGAGAGQVVAVGIYAFGRGVFGPSVAGFGPMAFYALTLAWAGLSQWLWPSAHWIVHLAAATAGFALIAVRLKPVRCEEIRGWFVSTGAAEGRSGR